MSRSETCFYYWGMFLRMFGRMYIINFFIKKMKTKKDNIRKLTKVSGHSISITLPIEMVRGLGWREKQRVVVKRAKGGLIIRDFRSKK